MINENNELAPFYDAKYIRDLLKQHILQNTGDTLLDDWNPTKETDKGFLPFTMGGLHLCRDDKRFTYRYHRLLSLSQEVALQHYRSDIGETMRSLMLKDLARVTVLSAVTAWLTTDGLRWHNLDPDVPEDLSYGLVLQYPRGVLSYAAMIANINRAEALKQFPPILIKECEELAARHVGIELSS